MRGIRVVPVAVVLVTAGCTSTDDKPTVTVVSTGISVTLTAPPATPIPKASPSVVIRPVTEASPEVRLKDREGEEYALGPVAMKLERFNQAYVMPAADGPGHVIHLELPSDLAAKFAELTLANEGKRLAVVAGDTVIFAPEITGAIVDGRIQISGGYTERDANAILTSITGR